MRPFAPVTQAESSGYLPGTETFDSYRRQEYILIGLNVLTLAGLLAMDLAFKPFLASLTSPLVAILFALRAVWQVAELEWLRRKRVALSPKGMQWHTHYAIWTNVLFAFVASIASNTDEAHYVVLLMLPLTAACFRYRLLGISMVVFVCSWLAFLELAYFSWLESEFNLIHYFEMATTILIYPVIGAVIGMMVQRMRQDAQELERTIAELEQTRDRLVAEKRLAAVGRLASAVAHEIRNPVAMIVSALDTVKRNPANPGLSTEFCEIAATEAHRLERLTAEFLNFARTKKPDIKPVAVRPALEYVAKLAEAYCPEDGPEINLECALPLEAPMDEFQIHQALLNLVLNAIQHAPPGGRVSLGAERHNGTVDFFVENTGDPVSQDHDDEVFEPFYTTRHTGTGLGLPISRKIARAHGGDLNLTRNDPDHIRFTLSLPAAP
ncbi:MAG: HAMP domain-containing histidine kinase [Candidatus Hydrogenedentes bacterium]|nr:HAMP domain-containing histidine kinase [Candidatus Hydrogenedentota bacterium]